MRLVGSPPPALGGGFPKKFTVNSVAKHPHACEHVACMGMGSARSLSWSGAIWCRGKCHLWVQFLISDGRLQGRRLAPKGDVLHPGCKYSPALLTASAYSHPLGDGFHHEFMPMPPTSQAFYTMIALSQATPNQIRYVSAVIRSRTRSPLSAATNFEHF